MLPGRFHQVRPSRRREMPGPSALPPQPLAVKLWKASTRTQPCLKLAAVQVPRGATPGGAGDDGPQRPKHHGGQPGPADRALPPAGGEHAVPVRLVHPGPRRRGQHGAHVQVQNFLSFSVHHSGVCFATFGSLWATAMVISWWAAPAPCHSLPRHGSDGRLSRQPRQACRGVTAGVFLASLQCWGSRDGATVAGASEEQLAPYATQPSGPCLLC